MKNLFLLVSLLIIQFFSFAQTPVEINGKLQLEGYQLSNQDGFPVQLRGMSSHGLQWYGGCFNENTFQTLRDDWGADIVRLAMYTSSGGYYNDPTYWKGQIETLVEDATGLGLYVMIDWHILSDNDPTEHQTEAIEFFSYMAEKYKNYNNVIYEICNEPNNNGDNGWSDKIKPYAEAVIPAIRQHDEDGIIIVGTPAWSAKVADVVADPLPQNLQHNIMYTFHFYAGSHFTQSYINNLTDQVPIFSTEWGTSHYSGQGGNNYENADAWLDLFQGQNKGKQLISWCNWSMSDKDETSAALIPGSCGNSDWNNTSESGTYVKNRMLRPDRFITKPLGKPQITIQPASVSAVMASEVHIFVQAFGAGQLSYQWRKDGDPISGANEEDLILENVSADDLGIYDVVISNASGQTISSEAEISLSTRTPYEGNIQIIPGRVEAEFFDEGGEGVAYHDLDGDNMGYAFRTSESVDIYETEDENSEYSIGSIGDNEWLEYTVNVTETGFYTVDFRVSSLEDNAGRVYIEIDGKTTTTLSRIPGTGSYDTWTTVNFGDQFELFEGIHTIRFTADNGMFNLNFMDFRKLNIDCNGIEDGTAVYDDCGVCGGDNSSCTDCMGVLNGDAVEDRCGECNGDGSSCLDCEGVMGGEAYVDDCGVCVEGSTGRIPNEACKDCEGIINGTAYVDNCGECVGGFTGKLPNESCIDCEGVLNGGKQYDDCGVCGGDNSSCNSSGSDAYNNTPAIFPGKLEFENYDVLGNQVSFNDADAGNNGNAYRNDDVDIEIKGSRTTVGWTNDGEYLVYTIDVKYTGNYTFSFRGGANGDNKTITLLLDENTLLENVLVTNTNSYDIITDFEINNVSLAKGVYKLKVEINDHSLNLDYIDVQPEFNIDCFGVVNGTAVIDDCGICNGDNSTCTDCAGTPNGTAYEDKCGNCVEEGTEACKTDCAGEWGGSAIIDACGVCAGGSTGLTPTENESACITDLEEGFRLEQGFTLFPNPAAQQVNAYCPFNTCTLEVYNLKGQVLIQEQLQPGNNAVLLKELENGVYPVKMYSGTQVFNGKVVKLK